MEISKAFHFQTNHYEERIENAMNCCSKSEMSHNILLLTKNMMIFTAEIEYHSKNTIIIFYTICFHNLL